MENESLKVVRKRRSRSKAILTVLVGLLLLWLFVAYLLAPEAWKEFAVYDPALDYNTRLTQTSDHHPGDPLNVQLIGTELQVQNIMKVAGWYPAVALGLEADLAIAVDSVLSRPDDQAPVSKLYLFGRMEDLAFEQPVGDSPRHRHHVRFWKTETLSADGRPRWIGSAIYDERVGLSHSTGQITHVTSPDVDKERDYLFQCLEKTEYLAEHSVVVGFHKQLTGFNGGGDPWRTSGDLYVGVIKVSGIDP